MTDKALMEKIRGIIKPEFPEDTVDVAPGHRDNIHVLVMSRLFDGMSEKDKQDRIWQLLDKSDLTTEEKLRVSLILPLSPSDVVG